MNREKEDQLPMMQVGFIDSICLPIYEVSELYPIKSSINWITVIIVDRYIQAFALLSDKLDPLVEGVRSNKQHWIEIAESSNECTNHCTNHDRSSIESPSSISNSNSDAEEEDSSGQQAEQ